MKSSLKNITFPRIITAWKSIILVLAAGIICALATVACGSDHVSDQLDTASDALATEDYATAQAICDNISRRGLDDLTETNLGRMAIIYMQLSDHQSYEDNVAAATECIRQALKVSADSLASFGSTLTPDEEVHFTLVRRIAGGIDNPVDLTKEDIADEDGVDNDHNPNPNLD